ncbi:Phosphoenolpyruvate synthase, partial [hydrothermal vent metagenome]
MDSLIRQLGDVGMADIEQVGGKNASLGEMISNLAEAGVQVPGGFATTADAFWEFLSSNGLDVRINELLDSLDIDDVVALTRAGTAIRQWVVEAPLGDRLKQEITDAYLAFSPSGDGPVAVRSSATAEDLPDASFAGQQETFLNVVGVEAVLQAIHEVFASLYNDRAISYRVHKGFAHSEVALSAGVQQMVRSDCGSSGVMFTMDTESGHDGVVFITSAYGLGELVVQGAIVPDEFYVFKKAL